MLLNPEQHIVVIWIVLNTCDGEIGVRVKFRSKIHQGIFRNLVW